MLCGGVLLLLGRANAINRLDSVDAEEKKLFSLQLDSVETRLIARGN